MKLLLDENLSRRVVPFLQQNYPGSSQVVLLGLQAAMDAEIWEFAKAQGYVVVSRDVDFLDLSLLKGAPPKLIRLRTPNSKSLNYIEYVAIESEARRTSADR